MINRPFSTTNVNVFDERTQNTTPTNIYGQNVLLSQEQHRKIFDTLTTSITGMPPYNGVPFTADMNGMPGYIGRPTMFQNNPQPVTFTFNRNPGFGYHPQNYWQYHQMPQMQNLAEMQRQNELDLMQLQQQVNMPGLLKFHLDNQTSTSDLETKHKNEADLKNLAGMLCSRWPPWLATPMTRNHKKLILRNVTAKVEGTVYDQLEDNDNEKKKKVSFDFGGKKDEECQVKICCQCCERDAIEYSSPRHQKKKRRSKSSSIEFSTDDEDDKR